MPTIGMLDPLAPRSRACTPFRIDPRVCRGGLQGPETIGMLDPLAPRSRACAPLYGPPRVCRGGLGLPPTPDRPDLANVLLAAEFLGYTCELYPAQRRV